MMSNGLVGGSERLLIPEEACEVLAVSLPTLYRLVNRGDLHAVRVGRQLRFLPQALRDYLNQGQKADQAEKGA